MRPISGICAKPNTALTRGGQRSMEVGCERVRLAGLAAFFFTGPGCASVLAAARLDIRNPSP
jgi:hypothetical protein